jgi:hypothetical protein
LRLALWALRRDGKKLGTRFAADEGGGTDELELSHRNFGAVLFIIAGRPRHFLALWADVTERKTDLLL